MQNNLGNTLQTYAFPVIGHKKVSDVTSSDILKILQPIWLTKRETARRIRQRMSTIFKWTVASELRKDDPTLANGCFHLNKQKIKTREKALAYDQVKDCLNAISNF